jgi:hypothetical protein
MINKKGQVSTEFVVILSLVLVIAVVVVVVGIGIPRDLFMSQNRQDNFAWYNAPLGIRTFVANNTHGTIAVANNMRESVNITGLWLNEKSYSITSLYLESGMWGYVTFVKVDPLSSVMVILGVNATFRNGNMTLNGVPYHVKTV